ncbi:MAG: PHP domain-containing protein [Syntrophomonadaceae bacterium]|nr:PHP domain-containing protein [Syntrophomonadaceae bacterium]
MYYDLHIHTNASDGEDAPETVILKAVEAGLSGLAITDHDTLAGLEPARHFIEENRLEIDLIPGIELNTDYDSDDLHILGYFINCSNGCLQNRLDDIRAQRYARAEKIIALLQDMGINITLAQVQATAQGKLIGRPHIARVLCGNGYANSQEEAFQRYIERGRPAYVPRYKFSPLEAIELIKQSGGIAVLAHPGLIKDRSKIYDSIKYGIEGLEVFYPEHTEAQVLEFANLAGEYNLLITGGSDYHGANSGASRGRLGLARVDKNIINRMKQYYREKKQKE